MCFHLSQVSLLQHFLAQVSQSTRGAASSFFLLQHFVASFFLLQQFVGKFLKARATCARTIKFQVTTVFSLKFPNVRPSFISFAKSSLRALEI